MSNDELNYIKSNPDLISYSLVKLKFGIASFCTKKLVGSRRL